jgi:hypothetical protein
MWSDGEIHGRARRPRRLGSTAAVFSSTTQSIATITASILIIEINDTPRPSSNAFTYRGGLHAY